MPDSSKNSVFVTQAKNLRRAGQALSERVVNKDAKWNLLKPFEWIQESCFEIGVALDDQLIESEWLCRELENLEKPVTDAAAWFAENRTLVNQKEMERCFDSTADALRKLLQKVIASRKRYQRIEQQLKSLTEL